MKTKDVMVVRIYVTESSHLLKEIVNYLKNETKIHGISVFRAVSGFGESGDHTASFMDLSLDLPLAIEFFDDESNVRPALEHLNNMIKPKHMVFWKAQVNCES